MWGKCPGLAPAGARPRATPLEQSDSDVNGSKIQPQGFTPSADAAVPRAVAVFQDSMQNWEMGS